MDKIYSMGVNAVDMNNKKNSLVIFYTRFALFSFSLFSSIFFCLLLKENVLIKLLNKPCEEVVT